MKLTPIFVLVFLISVSADQAHAYIDPGTGSMISQILLAGFAGLGVATQLFWRRFMDYMSGLRKSSRK